MTVDYTFYSSRPRIIEDEGGQLSGFANISSYTAGGEDCTEVTRKFKDPWTMLFERDPGMSDYFAWDRAANTIMILQASGAEATVGVSATCYFTVNGLAHLSWGKK